MKIALKIGSLFENSQPFFPAFLEILSLFFSCFEKSLWQLCNFNVSIEQPLTCIIMTCEELAAEFWACCTMDADGREELGISPDCVVAAMFCSKQPPGAHSLSVSAWRWLWSAVGESIREELSELHFSADLVGSYSWFPTASYCWTSPPWSPSSGS